jgi:tripartite-type tricarboxylate transporter receptor subunit TctC
MKRFIRLTVLLLVVSAFAAAGIFASGSEEAAASGAVEQWPSGAVTIVCPTRAGGFADVHSRILADYLQRSTGVPFAVVNASEGGGNIGSDTVRYAKPDGRTLLHFHTSFPIAAYTGVYDGDPKVDFSIIAATQTGGYHVFATRADAPYDNIEELVQYAKANPETVKWGAAAGVTSHFMMALLEREADVKFKMLDAGNEGERVTAMLGGFIDVSNFGINSSHQHVQAGNMKILGVIGATRDKNLTQYPTIREQGYDVVWQGAFGLYGPADMEPELLTMINESLIGFGDDEKAREALNKMGADFEYMNLEESVAYYHEQFDNIQFLAKEFGF